MVTKNSLISYEGSTGYTTGKHLHTSLLIDGKLTDPLPYMKNLEALPLQSISIDNTTNNIESEYKIMIRRVVSDINLRTGAGVNNSVIRVLHKGAIFTVAKTVKIANGDIGGTSFSG